MAAESRTKTEPDHHSVPAEVPAAAAVPVHPANLRIAANPSFPGEVPDRNQEADRDSLTTLPAMPGDGALTASVAPQPASGEPYRRPAQAAVDSSVHSKAEPARRESASDRVPDEGARNIFEAAAAPPLLPNSIQANSEAGGGGADAEALSHTDKTEVVEEVAEVLAQPRSASPSGPRLNATETAFNPDRPSAVDAGAADGGLSRIEPAFEALLQPSAQGQPAAAPGGGTNGIRRPSNESAQEPPPLAGAEPVTARDWTATASADSKRGGGSRHPPGERAQEKTATTESIPPLGAETAEAKFDVSPAARPAGPATPSERPSEPAPQANASTPAHQSAAAPAAHDVKLELNGNGQRVEVRLTERGGDVNIAVRTADQRLSGAMREDLPALAAKLEQSGFHTDVWHQGAAGEPKRALETSGESASHDSREHTGQDRQQKQESPQQQHSRNAANAAKRKSDRKDFAWLLQTYR
jgi:hypothetical protein